MVDRIGKFRVKAIAAELGRAKTKTPQVAVRFAVVEGDATGEEITWYGFLTEAAQERTIEGLIHTGWTGDSFEDLSTVGSKDCEIEVAEEEYEGKLQWKVKWVNALGGGGIQMADVMSPQERKTFAGQMRGSVLAVRQKMAAKGSGAPAPARQPAPRRAPAPHPNAPGNDYGPPIGDEPPV
jgi:hypothetical protein